MKQFTEEQVNAINSLIQYNDEWRKELAKRVFNLNVWEALNEDATPDSIAESIKDDPLPVIEYILDYIDEYY